MQEGIISFLLEDYRDKDKREFVSAFLNTYPGIYDKTKLKLSYSDCEDLEEELREQNKIKEWSSVFKDITEVRNDINHAGMKKQSFSANVFEDRLKKLYNQTMELMHSC